MSSGSKRKRTIRGESNEEFPFGQTDEKTPFFFLVIQRLSRSSLRFEQLIETT